MRYAVTLPVALTVLLAGPLPAQGPETPPCGDLPLKQTFLERNLRHFTRKSLAPLRDSLGIDRLPEDVARRVLDEPEECGRIFGQVTAHIARLGETKRLRTRGFRHAIFRYGPYYAVLIVQDETDESDARFTTGYGDLFILRASDLEVIGRILS